jgi:NAD+ kinase
LLHQYQIAIHHSYSCYAHVDCEQVEEKLDEFDATRSSGHLCAATAGNFEQVLDEILEGTREPVKLQRISTFVDGIKVSSPALNDVLVAHPNPAAVSRCTFR